MGEKIANGFMLLVSIAYWSAASSLSFGAMQAPKAGFVPTIIGACATFISAWLLVRSLLGKGDAKDAKLNVDIKKTLMIIGVMLAYILIMKLLGYIVASFVALLAILKIAQVKGWKTPIIVSICGSVGFYLIFDTLLSVMLP